MGKKWITTPRSEGKASKQAHADLPEGTFERELGKEGFFGPATHMHHRHPPTGWTNFEGALKPRAFDTTKLDQFGDSPWSARPLMSNAHCRIRIWEARQSMDHLVRNGDGDELLFIHSGAGELFCDYGRMSFSEGDYIVLPRGTMWRLAISEPARVLMIEATNASYMLPDRGLLGPNAIFDTAALGMPEIDQAFLDQQDENEWEVRIKRREAFSRITYPFNPLDAVGWHGDLVPVRLNWRDIRPLMSHRYHLPPSAHTTFVANRFVICTFVPRPFETDPGALKVPFFHNNDDFDEVIFYHAGDFFSRDNIHPGMMSLHPCGFTHGPHPKALKNAFEQKAAGTEEVAVMIDTRDALDVDEGAGSVEWGGYVDSWKPKS
ncbi:homogentisate 1,2-dioxygenase [Marinihelvus fidelis]|uniref:Homogentisate 1,2-dioxygenase n=1 Tax=Marinihelvus fidelis TaxID=2613842 RepID=A0A5N0T8J1_9GAMM|nr:homogentisate 1,2-dioxygenase [Marinihelvus fidelis]KAA9129619.1 homogentisate 1,2-dioxygenase [Marinihelvus fidelis]